MFFFNVDSCIFYNVTTFRFPSIYFVEMRFVIHTLQ